jgi:hypothetical protein
LNSWSMKVRRFEVADEDLAQSPEYPNER